MMCISVLLPLPDAPMIATYSPAAMSRLTPRSAWTVGVALAVDLRDVAERDDRASRSRASSAAAAAAAAAETATAETAAGRPAAAAGNPSLAAGRRGRRDHDLVADARDRS